MKSFIVLFTAAREVSTPLVAVRIFGPSSSIQSIGCRARPHSAMSIRRDKT